MKSYFIKMICIVLIISSFIIVYKEKTNKKVLIENVVVNNVIYQSDIPNTFYQEELIVYEGLTLKELGLKIDHVLNSTLDGYGELIASLALEHEVDPLVAASIILLETGCKWSCSRLVQYNHNVGGMRGSNGYLYYETLEEGIEAFINNLAYNYYAKGLNTPELMNQKYATNPEWYKTVYYYVDLNSNAKLNDNLIKK